METTVEKKIIPAESGHYYTKDGAPAYEVPCKSRPGEMRPTTLRDAKALGLLPSVTTILQVMSRPGLESWKQTQLVLAALTLPRLENEPLDAFAERVITDAQEHGKQAAGLGTEIHAAIQAAFEGHPVSGEYAVYVDATREAMMKEWPVAWNCEQTFAHPLGFAGKVDAFSGRFVIDWKTTAFDEKKLPKGYDEHLIQLAGYALGLGIENSELANVYISTSNPGLVHIVKWSAEERAKGTRMFLLLLELWKMLKNYNSSTV